MKDIFGPKSQEPNYRDRQEKRVQTKLSQIRLLVGAD